MTNACEHLILGAGLRGLEAALTLPAADRLVVDAMPQPGGSTRTQRSNGFACELGRFAFAPDEIAPLLAKLRQPPVPIACAARHGYAFDGERLIEVAVEPAPVSFATGCEEVVQACRRELGAALRLGRAALRLGRAALRLGRAVTEIALSDAGFQIELGGEVPTTLTSKALTVALPTPVAAALFAGFDPALADTADRLERESRAFVFLGGLAGACTALRGYGIVPADGSDSAVTETIFCSNAFPGRDLGGRFLLRCELAGEPAAGADADLVATATAELRRQTGHAAAFGFTKVHRFESTTRDATWAECRVRLLGLATRIAGLTFA